MRKFAIGTVVALLAVSAALAQSTAPRQKDLYERFLFPPELIMRNQLEIGLDAEQREAIKNAAMEAESTFLGLKWEIHAEAEKLAGLLEPPRVDPQLVLQQAERVMNIEKTIKKTHIRMLLMIKNTLTEQQQQRLFELRQRQTPRVPSLPPAPDAPSARPSSLRVPSPPGVAPGPEPPTPPAVPASDGASPRTL
jgi:hypothetical protein